MMEQHEKRAGINTLGDLSMKTLNDMHRVRNLGRRSLQEIEKKMAEYGLRFKPEEAKSICPNCGADMRGEQDDESRSNSNAQTDTRARGMGATDKSSGL